MRIVFLGEDSFSNEVLLSLINFGHEIVAVITPAYNNFIFKKLERTCLQNNIPFFRELDVNSIECEERIRKTLPEIIAICHFQKLLKPNIISLPSKGCINLHPSLLPNYRGMAPQHWPIINGENETGITVHYVNEEADKGDIILQKRMPIDENIYIADFQMEMLKVYKIIMVEALNLITKDNFVPQKQNHIPGSYYGRLRTKDCILNIDEGILKAYNIIRAVSRPYFGAEIEGFRIWKVRYAEKELQRELNSKFSKGIFFTEKYGNFISFKDGVLIIKSFNKK